jgi:hypothetical protein
VRIQTIYMQDAHEDMPFRGKYAIAPHRHSGIIASILSRNVTMKRHVFVIFVFSLAAALILPLSSWAGDPPAADVYKSATCGCCSGWEKHLRAAGFTVRSHIVDDVSAMREKLGMPQKYASCHTARIGKYLVEGHVPASDVRRLLDEQPDAIGLAAPGMPSGSPGMEFGAPQDYDVLLVGRNNGARVFQHHPAR